MDLRPSIVPQQKFLLSQALLRSLEILQLPALELGVVIAEEIEKNPLLELTAPPFSGSREIPEIEALPSLYDHLMAQIRESFSGEDLKTAEGLLEQLDERGFLTADAPEPILNVLQSFDPPGIFARNLREAFLLQLEKGSDAYRLVEEGFEDLMRGRFKKLEKKFGVDVVQKLLRLKTRPASPFDYEVARPIYPDIKITRRGCQWVIESIEEALPKFRIKTELFELPNLPKEQQSTLRTFAVSAKWIRRCIEKRRKMLLELTKLLLEKKFNTPAELASELGVHESTISRALSEKYVDTPDGYKPLRALMSTHEPKELIHRLIAQEDKNAPLTDKQLVLALKKGGHSVARRTVAKYRHQLHLGSAAMRKALH